MAPDHDAITVDENRLDAICEAFADVIDAKSHFTFHHSTGVAHAAVAMGLEMGFDPPAITTLRRAALLHDIGKLSVSNAILEKPGKLTSEEWDVVRRHPYYTEKILERAPIFNEFAAMAAAHHEKLDGSGYHLALVDHQMSLPARALAVADIYDALAADRPYRKGMPLEKVLKIISEDAPHKLDPACVEALKAVVLRADWKVPEPGFVCATESDPSFVTSTTEAVEIDEVEATRVF
jgi:putative nucleotidyltransferase with HDIG domain